MIKKNLGVNIDHVATIRNARGENYPAPLRAALLAQESGANSITIHLREDRRHIKDSDLKEIKKKIKIPLNLEIAPTIEMMKIAIKNKPNYVCLVPEKRKEITTEGGLNVKKNFKKLKSIILALKKNKIRVSLFIEPKKLDIKESFLLKCDCVELHTGKFCNLFIKNKKKLADKAFENLKLSALYAKSLNLEVHAGHGMTYVTAKKLCKIKDISEFNIGHFIISESIFKSLKSVIKKFKNILKK
jgi:pyridoxine 5-phosphate synthase